MQQLPQIELEWLPEAAYPGALTVPLGSAATFQAPADWTGDSEIKATYSILGNLISQTSFVGDASLDLTALASGVALTGGVGTLLLAAAPGAGGTATLTAGANEMMVAGQEGDVIFNTPAQNSYEGTLVGLNAGDQINLQNFFAAEVFLQGSNLVFVTDNDDFYILSLSGDYSDINFVLNSSNLDSTNVVLTSTDSNVVGNTAVTLQGSTTSTWSQETNLGDLTADSMRGALTNASGGLSAPAASPPPVVSLRTASTIWTGISGTANPETGKPAGGISQFDIEHALPSDYKLMAFDTTAAGLKEILEHAVAAGGCQSRFAQVGGLRFSYDLDERPGSRIKSIALIDESGIVTARVVADAWCWARRPPGSASSRPTMSPTARTATR